MRSSIGGGGNSALGVVGETNMPLKGLIEISNRYSHKGLRPSVNPYIVDISSSKKALKKKSDSIDAVSHLVIDQQTN